MIVIKPEGWYLVQGVDLLRVRLLIRNLQEEIRRNGATLTTDDLQTRLHNIIEAIPKTPAQAF